MVKRGNLGGVIGQDFDTLIMLQQLLSLMMLLLLQIFLEFVLVKGEIEEPSRGRGGTGIVVDRRAIQTGPVSATGAERGAGARGIGSDGHHHHRRLRTGVVVQPGFEGGSVGGGGGSRGVGRVEPGMRWRQ